MSQKNIIKVQICNSILVTVSVISNSSNVLPSETDLSKIMKSNIKYAFSILF